MLGNSVSWGRLSEVTSVKRIHQSDSTDAGVQITEGERHMLQNLKIVNVSEPIVYIARIKY